MGKVYVFLAEGFEEIEALTVVDMLRRVKVETVTVSVTGKKQVCGSHQIPVEADVLFEETDFSDGVMAVLPGGMPGTLNLQAHEGLKNVILSYAEQKKYLAAICAAPSVLGAYGILENKCATCYPGFEEKLTGATISTDAVITDGNVITSRGMGTAILFGGALVSLLTSEEAARQLLDSIQFGPRE